MRKKILSLSLLAMMISPLIYGQDSSTVINFRQSDYLREGGRKRFPGMLLVPTMLIGYGAASLGVNGLKNVNGHFQEELYLEHNPAPLHIDNYLQVAPALMVYGLNIAGIKGKNNFRDRTIIYAMSNVIMGGTVFLTKNLTQEQRPDGSDRMSFPSGHTATAFAAAEFLRQEYKDVSPWYGIAGYAMAATTGYFRMHNNKHWLGDVVAGAGVGILSTDLAYYIYPSMRRMFTNKKTAGTTIIVPTYQQGVPGISMVHVFR
ncbi:phosphatase PAP2 family protein [Chitinophaga niabensis]|uniref:PAP2 superfamily protein n=1 Tax=Chitinophaga niabensis TaxID=536979 RepID=A0A1N6JQ45_9BACT|nr:phosphatase PAP2 family protein [Chitinophaga niabensis]SIO46468.1 PAP2 superfamily protein [Chitinophaga niabensis]